MSTTPALTAGGGGGTPVRSASAIIAVTESGQHLLRIDGYSHTTGVPAGSDVKSSPFRVGGHSWRISYYPSSSGHTSSRSYPTFGFGVPYTPSSYDFQPNSISLSLQLDDDDAAAKPQGDDVVRARHSFTLLDREGKPGPYFTDNSGRNKTLANWGTRAYINRSELEKPEHLHGDSFTIRCDVTVVKEIQAKSVGAAVPPPRPPPGLHRDLGGLLASGEAADVAFEVDGKGFLAHRCVLMARSPVFRAELSGPQAATSGGAGSVISVRVEDMEAQDFEALLRYVYTDSLPEEMEEHGEAAAMLPDLVAAANRYEMGRLKLLCEDKLRELVDVRTVAIMLEFAREHRCHGLEEACLRFLDDPGNVREVVKVNGLQLLSKSCPSVVEDLIAKLAAAPYACAIGSNNHTTSQSHDTLRSVTGSGTLVVKRK